MFAQNKGVLELTFVTSRERTNRHLVTDVLGFRAPALAARIQKSLSFLHLRGLGGSYAFALGKLSRRKLSILGQ